MARINERTQYLTNEIKRQQTAIAHHEANPPSPLYRWLGAGPHRLRLEILQNELDAITDMETEME